MSAQQAPTVFLSHSHKDRRVARRLVRRLTAHGIKVWIDERELRLGSTLTSSLRTQIEAADRLLVIASNASAVSKWVGLELEFAKEHGKHIIPLFIDSVAEHERFQNHKGVDATSPQGFADAVHDMMRELFLAIDLELPPPDSAVLEAELRAIAKEEPDLAPLILGCLDAEGLHQENMDTAYKAPFHPLDETLNALYDLNPSTSIAYHLIYGFSEAGAGTRALSLWIAATGDGGLPFASAFGSKGLDPALIPTAIKLLGSCDPPNNSALYSFIQHNADHFDDEQRRSVLRLVTWPLRTDTTRFADVLAWVAFRHFPEAGEIQNMWSRWIRTGVFDGKPARPNDLARYLADAHKEQLPGWESINEELQRHVRSHLRSGEKQKVVTAMDHIQAAADKGAPVLSALRGEAEAAIGSAEWVEWEKRDPNTAEWMRWYVSEIAEEARGEHNWLRAWERAKQMVADVEEHRRVLANEEQSNGDTPL